MIQGLPDGCLKAIHVRFKDKESFQYYQRTNSTDTTGRYLGRTEKELVKQLAQKEYCVRILKAAKNEKKTIERLCEEFKNDSLLEAYTGMKAGKRTLVEPFVLTDEEYSRRWQAKAFTGGKFEENDSVFYTKRGERVRSKSELIIADRLYDAGIPYRYEYPLKYDEMHSILTDFTVLNVRTRLMIRWEHFGKMDDPKYRKTFFWKQSIYMQCGYVQGINYVCTFEDNENPLDVRVVDKLIEKLFR